MITLLDVCLVACFKLVGARGGCTCLKRALFLEFLRQHLLTNVVCSAEVETEALTRNVLHHLINLVRETGNLTANGAPVIDTDIMGTNGVMHTIDRVLIPKNGKCHPLFSVLSYLLFNIYNSSILIWSYLI